MSVLGPTKSAGPCDFPKPGCVTAKRSRSTAPRTRRFWPQCGPAGGPLRQRYFKQKDVVENYLTAQVKSGNMDLAEAQKEIARAWTQFLEKAKGWCATHNCRGEP